MCNGESLKRFRKANGLKQDDLADYLGVSRAFVSLMETGVSKVPDDKLTLLLNQDKGWDTSMLVDGYNSIHATASGDHSRASINYKSGAEVFSQIDYLFAQIEDLKKQLAEEKKRSADYWEMIQKMMSR